MVLRRFKNELVWQASIFRQTVAGWSVAVHPSPTLILGNQKSGTTAIAALLSELTDTPATLDLRRECRNTVIAQVCDGRMSLDQFIQRNRLDFSRGIIKEPALTLLYQQLAIRFPDSQFVMVMRDPRDNIRSILNRLHIAGDLDNISRQRYHQMSPSWRLNIDNRWLGLPGKNYIEMLAHRWNHMVSLYEKHANCSLLLTYESFLQNKLRTIQDLANRLGLAEQRDIQDLLDVQYQPAGDRNVGWADFFGDQNLKRIEDICGPRMQRYGYSISR